MKAEADMEIEIAAVRRKLEGIEDEIRRGVFRTIQKPETEGWGGAGVVFTNRQPARSKGQEFYPEPKYVVTPHADEAAWLLHKLRDLFSGAGLIDSCSKIEFFGRLADAALRYQKHARDEEKATLLLAAMLAEAKVMLAEMEAGRR